MYCHSVLSVYTAWTTANCSKWQWQCTKRACGASSLIRAWTPIFATEKLLAPSIPIPTILPICKSFILETKGWLPLHQLSLRSVPLITPFLPIDTRSILFQYSVMSVHSSAMISVYTCKLFEVALGCFPLDSETAIWDVHTAFPAAFSRKSFSLDQDITRSNSFQICGMHTRLTCDEESATNQGLYTALFLSLSCTHISCNWCTIIPYLLANRAGSLNVGVTFCMRLHFSYCSLEIFGYPYSTLEQIS